MKAIYFDMDGTIANLYGVENWLPKLRAYDATPYEQAIPMVNMNVLARKLNNLQRNGWHIGIVSWLSKESTTAYDAAVTQAKMNWLNKHLRSVHFDEYNFLSYGTPKQERVRYADGILFDDEQRNRENWNGKAYDADQILEILRDLK